MWRLLLLLLLLFCGSVMDRSVILRHLASSPTDPFTGARLAAEQLVPQGELRGRILAWRSGLVDARRDVSVSVSTELLEKLGGEPLTPEMMAALVEAEALSAATKAAQTASAAGGARRGRSECTG